MRWLMETLIMCGAWVFALAGAEAPDGVARWGLLLVAIVLAYACGGIVQIHKRAGQ